MALSRLSRIACILLTVPLASFSARRWDATGHKTIARIAWDHMIPQARAAAVSLLRNGPPLAALVSLAPTTGTPQEIDRGLFVESATWPDYVRDTLAAFHGYHHGNWHYADTFWKTVGGTVRTVPGMDSSATNAIERLTALEAVLRDRSAADTTRAIALVWVLHLVGDIHQPLHLSSRITPLLPHGDRGGNSFKLAGPVPNLHAYWDDILDIETPLASGEDSVHYVDRLTTRVEHAVPHRTVGSAALHGSFQSWGAESLKLAEQKVYPATLQANQPPSSSYEQASDRIAERRIALAGYRLAELLNGIFR